MPHLLPYLVGPRHYIAFLIFPPAGLLSFTRQRIFLIASPIATHPAQPREHGEQGILQSDWWTLGPDEIAHLLEQDDSLQQVDVAFLREFAVSAQAELGRTEDLGRR